MRVPDRVPVGSYEFQVGSILVREYFFKNLDEPSLERLKVTFPVLEPKLHYRSRNLGGVGDKLGYLAGILGENHEVSHLTLNPQCVDEDLADAKHVRVERSLDEIWLVPFNRHVVEFDASA